MRHPAIFRLVLLVMLTGALGVDARPMRAQERTDEQAAADAARLFSRIEASRDYAALYKWLHPDARAIVPVAAVAGWFRDADAGKTTAELRVTSVRFVDWTWPVTGVTYPHTAEITFVQPYWSGGVERDVQDVERLVESGGNWRWFFGRSKAFVDAQIAKYAPPTGGSGSGSAPHVVAAEGWAFYESPSFGYVVDWLPADGGWRVQADQSGAGADQLVLDGDPGQVAFAGYQGYGGDAATCLADAAGQVERSAGVSGFGQAALPDDPGPPYSHYRRSDPTRAVDVYTMVRTDAGGQATTFALLLDCRALVPDSAVLLVSYLTTLDRFNDGTLFDQAETLMDYALALPRQSFASDAAGRLSALPGISHDECGTLSQRLPLYPQGLEGLMTDAAGNELGMVTPYGSVPPNSLLVLAENTGTHPFDVGRLPLGLAGNVSASGQMSIRTPRSLTVLALPSARGTGTVLDPGDRAVVRLEFNSEANLHGDDVSGGMLMYAAQPGRTVEIGVFGALTLCRGGAGYRPRIATGT